VIQSVIRFVMVSWINFQRLKPLILDIKVTLYVLIFLVYTRLCCDGDEVPSRNIDGFMSWAHLNMKNVVFLSGLCACILWLIDPLLRGDSVNKRFCYGAPAAYACAVMQAVFPVSPLRGYITRPTVSCWASAAQLRVHLWSVKQRETEPE
jgi:hypothetical protein